MQKKMISLIVGSLVILAGTGSFAADGDVIVNGNLTVNGRLILSKFYDSGERTITTGGILTLPHNFGIEPMFIQVVLICKTAEAGYNAGDKLFINPNVSRQSTYAQGVVVVPDSINLNIKFGNYTTVFSSLNKSTGATVNLTNTKWNAIFRAWAFGPP